MKAKRKIKPTHIERLTTYLTMSDGRKLILLDLSIDSLTVIGQLYSGTLAGTGIKLKLPKTYEQAKKA